MIKWNKKFSVGYKKIDKQHKELVSILNTVEKLLKNKEDLRDDILFEELESTFKDLLSYTEYHFKSEEKLMNKIGHDELKEHKIIHKNFIQDIKALTSDFYLDEDVTGAATKIYEKLLDWLMGHIIVEDMKYRKEN